MLNKNDSIVLPDHRYVVERIELCNYDRERRRTISRRKYHLREWLTKEVLVLTWDELCQMMIGERV